jgi:FkbM family methyltransferase
MRLLVKSIAVAIIRALFGPLTENGKRRVFHLLRQGMATDGFDAVIKEVKTRRGTVSLYCLGDLPLWRAETMLTKEPETLEWIDGMAPGDVLYDIGANVGVYSLYAAAGRNKVLAFEPLASNYFLLNRNFEHNNLAETASAYCLAFTDRDQIDHFFAQDTDFGAALSTFGEHIEQYGQSNASNFKQGMIGMRLDSFITTYDPPFPTHIKIDVDGIEDKIIAGATNTLSDQRLKSISIELDDTQADYVARVERAIKAAGLKFVSKRRSALFDNTPSARTFNFVYSRRT